MINGISTAPWIINKKGNWGERCFEISVLRDDNEHGKISYGWFDNNKLLITHNGVPCQWPLTKKIWDKQIKLAQEVADELNFEQAKIINEAPLLLRDK